MARLTQAAIGSLLLVGLGSLARADEPPSAPPTAKGLFALERLKEQEPELAPMPREVIAEQVQCLVAKPVPPDPGVVEVGGSSPGAAHGRAWRPTYVNWQPVQSLRAWWTARLSPMPPRPMAATPPNRASRYVLLPEDAAAEPTPGPVVEMAQATASPQGLSAASPGEVLPAPTEVHADAAQPKKEESQQPAAAAPMPSPTMPPCCGGVGLECIIPKLLGDSARYRYLPGETGGFGIQDLEFGRDWEAAWWTIPERLGWMHFNGNLGLGVHWWSGPTPRLGEIAPELPPRVYDLYYDFQLLQRVNEFLVLDLMVTPGFYGDLDTAPTDTFRLKGHAVGLLQVDCNLQLVAGFDYLNWETIDAVPIFGVLWEPEPGVHCRLVFPRPLVAVHLGQRGGNDVWGYVGGGLAGGAWAFQTPYGDHTDVEYNDRRVFAGIQLTGVDTMNTCAHLEFGYSFNREINSTDWRPDYDPRDTWFVSLWFAY